jgi:hypothetical protein
VATGTVARVFDPAAFAVARLAERLFSDYLGYDALLKLGRDPRAVAHVPAREPGQNVPIGRIFTEHGREAIAYHYELHLKGATAPGAEAEHARVWIGGALLTLGDAMARNDYFDRRPLFEFVRHARNAVGHGNRFDIRNPQALETYPAYTERGSGEGFPPVRFEITPDLNGQPFLFDFMPDYEVLSLIQRIGIDLSNLGGDLPDGVDASTLTVDATARH